MMSTPIFSLGLAPRNPTSGGNRPQGETASDVAVATTRARETARAAAPFRQVLLGGVGLLVRGASVATSVVAGPVMAAAVREVGVGAGVGAGGGLSGSPAAPRPVSGNSAGPAGLPGGGSGSGVPLLAAGGGDQGDLATAHAMQRESQMFNLQLLELQEGVQQENRRFTTVSNVLRAKHDTAKAALSNIRS